METLEEKPALVVGAPCEEETKHPITSKTLIFNAVFGILPFVCPKLYKFVLTLTPEQQVQIVSGVFAVVNIILRCISSAKISFQKVASKK